jgi:hypothetical protein
MLSAADWTAMAADLAAVRGDNPVSITLRRGATTVTAQTVRVARTGTGGGRAAGGNGTEEYRGGVVILGATTLDIQVQDRFTIAGVVYRVTIVRPNRRAGVIAEAEMVE